MQSPGQMLSTMVLLSLDTHSNPVTQHDLGTTWTQNSKYYTMTLLRITSKDRIYHCPTIHG